MSKRQTRKTTTKKPARKPAVAKATETQPVSVNFATILANMEPVSYVRLLALTGEDRLRQLCSLDVPPDHKFLRDVQATLPGWEAAAKRDHAAFCLINRPPFKVFNQVEAAQHEQEAYARAAAYLVGVAVGRLTLTRP